MRCGSNFYFEVFVKVLQDEQILNSYLSFIGNLNLSTYKDLQNMRLILSITDHGYPLYKGRLTTLDYFFAC